MLITKFNKLIRNKFVWGIFAILVSLSMIGFFAPQPGGGTERRSNRVGQLFGEDVSREALGQARAFVQTFQPTPGGEEAQNRIEEEAWRRLAMLRFARRLGLQVSNGELVQAIRSDPSFQDNGTFSKQRYQVLVRQQLGIPIPVFEEYIREEILISHVRSLALDASLWIPASSLEDNAARFTDTYSIAYVMLEPEIGDISVREEGARELYDAEPERFRVPEQRRVVYATCPYEKYLAPEDVTRRQIEIRYESDPEHFAVTNADTQVSTTQPLEDVSEAIRSDLAWQEARAAALEQAMRLVDELSLADEEEPISIGAAADETGIAVTTSGLFQVAGPVPDDISTGGEFTQAAFQLSTNTPSQSFSFSIPGTNAVYVMQLHEVVPSYIPAFDEIVDDARAEANRVARERAIAEQVERAHEKLVASAADEAAFRMTAAQMGLDITEIKPFALADVDPLDIPLFQEIVPEVLHLQEGEITAPLETGEGIIIAYLLERVPATPEEREAIKPDLNRMMLDAMEQVHFVAWQDALLAEARSTPISPDER